LAKPHIDLEYSPRNDKMATEGSDFFKPFADRVEVMSEIDEIKKRYARRDAVGGASPRKFWDDFTMLAVQERERALINALQRRFAHCDARSLTGLDIGCGGGRSLLRLIELGFEPENIVGVELTANRAAEARRRLPDAVRVIEGDAVTAKLPDTGFDLIEQSTVFTSILDDSIQEALARRMWLLLRPGGVIVWYDFVYDNPGNKDVRGVLPARVRALFPEGEMTARRVTLAPPIGRPAARLSPLLYSALNTIPLLRSHLFAVIAKD
jgi:SAM-dependent methyltransferase